MELPDLSAKVAVITGASRGLGAGMAEYFRAQGMRLALCARSPLPFAPSDTLFTASFDVADANAMSQFAEDAAQKLGPLDLWVNNAGVLDPVKKLRDLTPEELQRHLDVNLFGVLYGSQAFLRQVVGREGEGVLLNISSGAAWSGYAGWGAYCMGKAAMDRLTETLALEEAAHGLRAHAVAPGIIDTDMQAQIRASSPEVFPMVEKFHEYNRKNLFHTPEFVAEQLLRIAFANPAPTQTVLRLPLEQGAEG